MPLWVYSDTGMLGAGTSSNPYQIATAEQLAQLATWVNDGNTTYNDKYYIQTANIDLSAYSNWVPIGIGNYFSGSYDGNGFAIYKLNQSTIYAGLFQRLSGTIKNLGIESGIIDGTNSYACAFASLMRGTIIGCYNKATIISSGGTTATSFLGGISSIAYSDSTIENCVNFGQIIQNSVTTGIKYSSGIAGTNLAGSTISKCLATGIIGGSTVTTKYSISSLSTGITNCYQDTITTATSQTGCLDRTTENCQGLDALTESTKLDGLGTTNWFSRAGDYPLPIKFKP